MIKNLKDEPWFRKIKLEDMLKQVEYNMIFKYAKKKSKEFGKTQYNVTSLSF